jgi:SAM-dependent methyltransferase
MPAGPSATPEQIKDWNVRYHDLAASEYDAKWGIDLGEVGQAQVRAKLSKALGDVPRTAFGDALEIGAGTGYFTLNMLQAGLIERATATDISDGMLEALAGSAANLGAEVRTVRAEAEELPFDDESFDLVFGHAVLHHLPDLDRAFGEFARVLRPGGAVAFCGEPSRYGDRLAMVPKRLGLALAPLWRRAVGAAARNGYSHTHGDHGLEWDVDVHAFDPADLRRTIAGAGLTGERIRGEELVANAFGWLTRSLEGSAEPDDVPMAWRTFAFRSYLALQRVDSALLEPRLPASLFYNLVLSARKPAQPRKRP